MHLSTCVWKDWPPWCSGKAYEHGRQHQILSVSNRFPLWSSGVEPGSTPPSAPAQPATSSKPLLCSPPWVQPVHVRAIESISVRRCPDCGGVSVSVVCVDRG